MQLSKIKFKFTSQWKSLYDMIFPVNTVVIQFSGDVSPATKYGNTWAEQGIGNTLRLLNLNNNTKTGSWTYSYQPQFKDNGVTLTTSQVGHPAVSLTTGTATASHYHCPVNSPRQTRTAGTAFIYFTKGLTTSGEDTLKLRTLVAGTTYYGVYGTASAFINAMTSAWGTSQSGTSSHFHKGASLTLTDSTSGTQTKHIHSTSVGGTNGFIGTTASWTVSPAFVIVKIWKRIA